MTAPRKLDLKKDRGLTIEWDDGATSYYSIVYLRRMSPSADAREQRKQMRTNPLHVLPSSARRGTGAQDASTPLTAVDAELVGNYAIRVRFSDGHETGIYSWAYLREIDPALKDLDRTKPPGGE